MTSAPHPAPPLAARARTPLLFSFSAATGAVTGASSRRRGASRSSEGLVPPRFGRALLTDDTGAATAEYAIATMAAVGFASLLVVIMRSDEVRGILTDMVRAALTVGV